MLAASRTASAPSPRVADDLMSGCVDEQRAEPGAHELLVVGDHDADHGVAPSSGSVGLDGEAAALGRRPHANVPPTIGGALAHADAARARRRAAAPAARARCRGPRTAARRRA